MAWLFADSFDFYAAIADAGTHWDTAGSAALGLGRFTGSQSLVSTGATSSLTKSSGSNDATHHLVFSFYQQFALSGSTNGFFITLMDGATSQCTLAFRSDGTITLINGAPGGSVIATYSSAFSALTWTGFEVEITIHNTTGAIHVRKNGNTSDDFSATGLNTRGSANNYANRIWIGQSTTSSPFNANGQHRFDDLLWFSTSGAAPNTWVGDIRSCQLTPNGDASVQFAKSPTNYSAQFTASVAGTLSATANIIRFRPVTSPATTGVLASLFINLNAGFTGNVRLALYDSTGVSGGPGTLLATSAQGTNPSAGILTLAVSGGPVLTSGASYWLATLSDATMVTLGASGLSTIDTLSQTYGSGFPSTAIGFAVTSAVAHNIGMNITPNNAPLVADVTQDGLTTYVYDSTVGHADFYDLTDLPFVPVSIIGLVTRGYVEKSDAGLRQVQLQLKSGATTVQSTTLTLATSFQYTSRVDTVDPATSAAWTAAAVNAVQVGPYVTA